MSELIQVVEPLKFDLISQTRLYEDKYTYRPEKGFKFLQKICFWLLKKLQCNASYLHETVRTTSINTTSIIDKIAYQEREILKHTNYEPSDIYIGIEDFHKLLGSDEVRHYLTFSSKMELANNGDRYFKGMKITIVPWMKGVLVVPNE